MNEAFCVALDTIADLAKTKNADSKVQGEILAKIVEVATAALVSGQ